jgi:hypothetical protein
MGEGLYHDRAGVTAYAEPYDTAARGDDEIDGAAWDDFVAHAIALLPPSWSVQMPMRDRWKGRARVLARNGLDVLTLYEDSYGRGHLTIAIRTDRDASLEALAQAQLAATAGRFFDALHRDYPLRVRTTAWTSAPYQPSVDRSAA